LKDYLLEHSHHGPERSHDDILGAHFCFPPPQILIGDRFIYCLADSEKKRAESYATWIKETIAAGEWELIRKSLQWGQLTGSPRFVDEIEKKIERRVEFRGPGRPRKVGK
jgi:putative transposase